jgi:hypothetical protein
MARFRQPEQADPGSADQVTQKAPPRLTTISIEGVIDSGRQ